MGEILDLGGGITGEYVAWKPDRSIESNRLRYEGIPDVERYGMILQHKRPDGAPHEGVITFDNPASRFVESDKPKWQVHCWQPLDCDPSVLCSCGWHGYIRHGRWQGC